MRLIFLGTSAGFEPIPGHRHTSFVIEHRGRVYWFDAGEGCSYTAHLLGIDLLLVRNIFISHTHMDHVGGLGNLLWNIRKLNMLERDPSRRLGGERIQVFIPNLSVWNGLLRVLAGTESGFKIDFKLEATRYRDGLILEDRDFRVTALHNGHLGVPQNGADWLSYSFLVEANHKRLVYSGDVKDVRDLDPFLDGCDLLLMEAGHHEVEDICVYLKEAGKRVDRLGFIHHGRAILKDPDQEARKARSILGDRIFMAQDGMALDL